MTKHYVLREAKAAGLKFPVGSAKLDIKASTLLIVTNGCGTIGVNGITYELGYGSVMFVHAGVELQLSRTDSAGMELAVIAFDAYKLVEEMHGQRLYQADTEKLPKSGMIAVRRFGTVIELSQKLISVCREIEPLSDNLTAQCLLLGLVQELFTEDNRIPSNQQNSPVQRVIAYIRENYNTKLSRPVLAQLSGYHPHYLSKQFSRDTGQSLSDYILQLRMDKAKELLLITSWSINEIALKVGYTDALYFSRKFKQSTGLYPTEFRQKPKRVVAYQFIGTLLALEITPVGIESRIARYSQQLQSKLTGIPTFDEWDMNQVRLLQPDMIVAPTYLRPEQLQQLQAIAPVIAQSWGELCPLERIRRMGQITCRQREAEAWIIQFNKWAERLRQRIHRLWRTGETAAVYEIVDGDIYVVSTPDRGTYALYEVLGLRPPEAIKYEVLEKKQYKIIKPWELAEYAADHMIVSIYESGNMEETKRLLQSEAWMELPAVCNDQMYQIPVHKCFSNDGISLQRLTSTLAQLLISRLRKR